MRLADCARTHELCCVGEDGEDEDDEGDLSVAADISADLDACTHVLGSHDSSQSPTLTSTGTPAMSATTAIFMTEIAST